MMDAQCVAVEDQESTENDDRMMMDVLKNYTNNLKIFSNKCEKVNPLIIRYSLGN